MVKKAVNCAVRVFISYETGTGLEYAREARRVFREAGYLAWMWESERTPGAYPAEEIAKNIELCDIFFYLCTAQEETQKWNGQPYERNLAWQLNKAFTVLTFDRSFVPLMLKAYTYVVVSVETFANRCREVVVQLATLQRLKEPVAGYFGEAEPLEQT